MQITLLPAEEMATTELMIFRRCLVCGVARDDVGQELDGIPAVGPRLADFSPRPVRAPPLFVRDADKNVFVLVVLVGGIVALALAIVERNGHG